MKEKTGSQKIVLRARFEQALKLWQTSPPPIKSFTISCCRWKSQYILKSYTYLHIYKVFFEITGCHGTPTRPHRSTPAPKTNENLKYSISSKFKTKNLI